MLIPDKMKPYFDRMPEIVADAIEKFPKMGFTVMDIDEDRLIMANNCFCIFGQVENSYLCSNRRRYLDICPWGYFEEPDNPAYYYALSGMSQEEMWRISQHYYERLTDEYKKQIKRKKAEILKECTLKIINTALRELKHELKPVSSPNL